NQVEIAKSQLLRITCRQGNFIFSDGEWKKLEHTGKTLREHYGKLPSILSLITKEQFQTITEEADTAVLIQGIAGSGKTTVALHRLSWLLHENNSELKEEDCIILVLSKSLKAYIQDSLPALQIFNVPVATLQDWAFEIIRNIPTKRPDVESWQRPEERCPAGIGRLKRSFAMLKALELYARKQSEELYKYLALKLPWDALPSGIRSIFDKYVDIRVAPGLLLEEVSESISLASQRVDSSHSRSSGLSQAMCIISEQRGKLGDLCGDLLEILSHPKPIIEFDETKLIDEELVRQAYERSLRNFSQGFIDSQDDALLIRLFQMKFGGLPTKEGGVRRYGHVIVDEIQDLSPIDIENVIGAVSDLKKLTLAGDIQQRIDDSANFPGWEKLKEDMLFKDSIPHFVTLNVSHRSTLPIMRLADHVQRQRLVKEGRHGRVPIFFKCRSESQGIKSAINWLKKAEEKYPTAITAVICADEEQARQIFKYLKPSFGHSLRLGTQDSFSFEEGILVTDIKQVKGLEFCNVLIWNPSKNKFPDNEISRNMLYVAITRAEENLCIVSWQTPSLLLPTMGSKLLRWVDLTSPEEE
ncbi:MAG: ATP-binding domain-containing protein, partial [SAR324 cluster bacterium]|nr:ATP-binding domain-containing protein [SAR324 cluster bacterium]